MKAADGDQSGEILLEIFLEREHIAGLDGVLSLK
jgi:hypothetical protein